MASAVARQLDAAKARAVAAIDKAKAAGFIVHEDLLGDRPSFGQLAAYRRS